MRPTPDSQIITTLARAIEPAIIRAVEKTVIDVLREKVRDAPVTKPKENRLLTVKEVAAFLSIGKSTVFGRCCNVAT
ncbi:MAG: hypothetical protein GY847_42005 [Proteobacteria bacterium]|nr:hypothetical protein [Pseudomonadota bacterium]